MFERRLYYHIDWALLLAILALCGLGVAMIYSTTSDPTRAVSHMHITQIYAIVIGLIVMVATLSLDYRTFTDKSHLIYIAILALLDLRPVLRRRADGRPAVDSAQDRQPAAVRVRQGRRRARAGEVLRRESRRAVVERSRDRRGAHRHSARADREGARSRYRGHAAADFSRGCLPGRHADAHSRPARAVSGARGAGGVEVRHEPVSEEPGFRRFSIRHRTRKAPDTSKSRRASRSDRAGLPARDSSRGRRGSSGFSPSPTTISFSRCWPRNRGLPASSWRSACICSLSCARSRPPAWPRIGSGSYLVLGVLASFTFQVIYNVTMSAGLAPVKGLTLPLMSYGGSSMIATLAGFGLVLNVRMRRFTN